MATTIYKITEQAKRLIKGGNPSAGSNIWSEEVKEYIGQVINKLLKSEHLGVNLPSGEVIPAGMMLANYDGLTVEQYKNTSRALLPAIPITLPRSQGIYYVGPDDDPSCEYIPVLPGQGRMIATQSMLNELITIYYEPVDGYVVFSKDISTQKVNMQLVVMDVSHYGDYDLLPIPADMEQMVIDMVVQRFSTEPRPDKVEDSGTEPTKNQQGR